MTRICLMLTALLAATGVFIPEDAPFDPDAVMKALRLDGVQAEAVREKLEAIQEVEHAFLWKRTAMETAFGAGLGDRSDIGALSARIAAIARNEQEKIDALAAEIAMFVKEAALPDLEERGKPIFGRYRRPAPGQSAADQGTARKEIASNVILRGLDLDFDHERHPKLKTGCVDCHKTNDQHLIEEAYGKQGDSRALLGRSEQIPTMDDCTECHYERGAIDDCVLCHPDYTKRKKLFSRTFNPFLRLKKGVPAPEFSLRDVERNRFSSTSAKGKFNTTSPDFEVG